MTAKVACGLAVGGLGLIASCAPSPIGQAALPLGTSLAFTNFSTHAYATLGIRDHADENGPFDQTPLLPPGATYRVRFGDLFATGCPESLDLRLWLYRRARDDLPIGLDAGEAVEDAPVVAGEVLDVLACAVQELETYTIVNWEAPRGAARVKIAQSTRVDDALRATGRFANVDAAWEISGVAPDLAETPPPPSAETERIRGHVTLADGSPVATVGVLLRTRFRVRLTDDEPGNDPDVGFSEPIAFTMTDDAGAFVLDRPAGGYQVEFFSDDYAFRPAVVRLEAPSEVISVIVEPLP